jgi:hypothetical protein
MHPEGGEPQRGRLGSGVDCQNVISHCCRGSSRVPRSAMHPYVEQSRFDAEASTRPEPLEPRPQTKVLAGLQLQEEIHGQGSVSGCSYSPSDISLPCSRRHTTSHNFAQATKRSVIARLSQAKLKKMPIYGTLSSGIEGSASERCLNIVWALHESSAITWLFGGHNGLASCMALRTENASAMNGGCLVILENALVNTTSTMQCHLICHLIQYRR